MLSDKAGYDCVLARAVSARTGWTAVSEPHTLVRLPDGGLLDADGLHPADWLDVTVQIP